MNTLTGAYPCAEIKFLLQRDIGYYVIQVFAPSILTVIMSWVSFWINIESVPARINLGLLTVVTITYQSTSVNATLPRVTRHRLRHHHHHQQQQQQQQHVRVLVVAWHSGSAQSTKLTYVRLG